MSYPKGSTLVFKQAVSNNNVNEAMKWLALCRIPNLGEGPDMRNLAGPSHYDRTDFGQPFWRQPCERISPGFMEGDWLGLGFTQVRCASVFAKSP